MLMHIIILEIWSEKAQVSLSYNSRKIFANELHFFHQFWQHIWLLFLPKKYFYSILTLKQSGMEVNYAEAIRYYELAAGLNEHTAALTNLAALYFEG